MISTKDKVFLKHELKKYADFFYVFSNILNGVILRKHFILFFVGNNKEKLKEWESIGLIETRRISNVNVILLRHCKALNSKRRPDYTRALILRSIMRMEFYLALGLTTALEIRECSNRGNNKVNRQEVSRELLGGYKAVLEGQGVKLPDLDSKANIDALNRLACHSVFISELRLKDKVLIPFGVCLAVCDDNADKVARELLFAYRELTSLFYSNTSHVPVKPVFLLCTFSQRKLLPRIIDILRQKNEFRGMSIEELKETFLILTVESPFPYLDPTNLV